MLFRHLTESKACLLWKSPNLFRFDKNGVVILRNASLPQDVGLPRTAWAFIDQDAVQTEPPALVTEAYFFSVQASSPDPTRYRIWMKQYQLSTTTFITKKWSYDELLKML
jgi:hypothetical protein